MRPIVFSLLLILAISVTGLTSIAYAAEEDEAGSGSSGGDKLLGAGLAFVS